MEINIRAFQMQDMPQMVDIWNAIVDDGEAFPQENLLNEETGSAFFGEQTRTAVAVAEDGTVLGMYILHPNNVGRCGHISNASFAVRKDIRGSHIGETLVRDCLKEAKTAGFRILQFNAVVENNIHARHLYERIGFHCLGMVPKGFRMKDGHYENTYIYYYVLTEG